MHSLPSVIETLEQMHQEQEPNLLRLYLNPHVAWNGKLELRTEEAKQAPLPFAVIEGGKGADQ